MCLLEQVAYKLWRENARLKPSLPNFSATSRLQHKVIKSKSLYVGW